METLAYAKLNLTIEVLGPRDDGYHEVRTILQTIDLSDRLIIMDSPKLQVECDQPSLTGDANLVWQGAMGLAQLARVEPKAHINIQKRIPIGMGLGGGSSDAAAALVALNRLWDLNMNDEDLMRVAVGLGSDVPFFLKGGTSLGKGRGELIVDLPSLPKLPLTLVCPRITVPKKTATMYSSLTIAHYSDGGITSHMSEIIAGGQFATDSVSGMMHNVFEGVVAKVFPNLTWLQQQLSALAPGRFHLSGAGPALFALAPSENDHERIAAALKAYPVDVYRVNTITPHPAA